MGLHARMLISATVVALALVSGASAASAQSNLVRVETPALQSTPSALVDRMPVAPAGAVTVTDPVSHNTATCEATSPIAALDAAVGPAGWTAAVDGTGVVTITSIKGTTQPLVPPAAPPGTKPAWSWMTMVSELPASDPCHKVMGAGEEALFFPSCTDKVKTGQSSCFTGGALYMRIRDGGPTDLVAQTVPGRGAPVVSHVILADVNGGIAPTLQASVSTDEGFSTTSNDPHKEGLATVSFTEFGPHWIRASQNGMVPVRMLVCASEGNDGFCGTQKVPPPPEIPYGDSPCDTNGHDGFCGTVDTSGPVTHVTNITNKQTFKKRKSPGQVKGTISEDPASVQYVKLRLTRVSTGRVLIKAKKKSKSKKKAKKRYRTVKRCMAWDDNTALFETAKCGTKYAKWFESDLDDLKQNFKYSFALTLPAGTYTLEVQSADLDNHLDAPDPGRNVITFTVAKS
jgi:hypothetical protein